MSKQIKVKLVNSPIGRTQDQRGTVKGLGLRKVGEERVLQDSPQVRGMIAKIPHLVSIVKD